MTKSIPTDNRLFPEMLFYKMVFLKTLLTVQLTKELQVKDVCIYAPGDQIR